MSKRYILSITKVEGPPVTVEGTDARDPLPGYEEFGYVRAFGPDGIYTSLSPRLQRIADRLSYIPNRAYGSSPSPDDLPEDSERVYGLTDFAFVTRPNFAGGGFQFVVFED